MFGDRGRLVLTRGINEAVVLFDAAGNEIGLVRVSELRGKKVRLAFEMPPEITIRREVTEATPAA